MNRSPRRAARVQPPIRGRLAATPYRTARVQPPTPRRLAATPTVSVPRPTAPVEDAMPNGPSPPTWADLFRLDQPWKWLLALGLLVSVSILLGTRL